LPVDESTTARAAAKIMFEVYREGGYDRRYRVVYFTELNDHNRDTELNRCLAGESFLSGFLAESSRKEGRAIITSALARLNDGDELTPAGLESELRPHLA
jgi:hypothetical protein